MIVRMDQAAVCCNCGGRVKADLALATGGWFIPGVRGRWWCTGRDSGGYPTGIKCGAKGATVTLYAPGWIEAWQADGVRPAMSDTGQAVTPEPGPLWPIRMAIFTCHPARPRD